MYWGKNSSLVIEECFWSFSQKHSSCLHVFFCLFVLKNGIFKNGIAGFCSPFVQENDSDLEQTSIAGSCGVFSELCLAEGSLASAQGFQLLWWEPARSGKVPPLLFPAVAADVEHN